MTVSTSRLSLLPRSWIPPSFAWVVLPDVFLFDVPETDHDVVEFLSTGTCDVTVYKNKKTAQAMGALIGQDSLRGQLQALLGAGGRLKSEAGISVYCHGVFLLGDGKTLCVAVGLAPPPTTNVWIAARLKAEADRLFRDHQARLAAFEDGIRRKQEENDALKERYKDDPRFGAWGDAAIGMEATYRRPKVTAAPLLHLLPRAAKFVQTRWSVSERIERDAASAIVASGLEPSRNGDYSGILVGSASARAAGLVSWIPHTGMPAYPEIRWAVQRGMPSSLSDPRATDVAKPRFGASGRSPLDPTQVEQGLIPDSNEWTEAFEDLQFDQIATADRVGIARGELQEQGFEAIAWFQPYHLWTEESWGIYFEAEKLDDLALSLLDDLRSHRIYANAKLAAFLALGLTYAHEMFHARVEAATSWQEINGRRPLYKRYQQRVYEALRETPDWLEEALANWSAWSWFGLPEVQSLVARSSAELDGVAKVVETTLDLGPPGYSEWRLGRQSSTWRTFANQLFTGSPKGRSRSCMPLESALTGPAPFDFVASDIPLRFVGKGLIADRLRSHPATFNIPQRRELERALKHFDHTLDASGGKGGHQKWTGPDRRAFILPTRDPVSPGVFKSFLHHVGIDKATYVQHVRPSL